jgi:Fe-S-cluster containining protein
VPLTGFDVIRIIEERGHSFADFVCRWADPDGLISRQIAPQFRFEDDPETPFVIGILQNESIAYPGTRKCRFLVETPDASRAGASRSICSIYESRPGACRVFPFRFEPSGSVGIQPGVTKSNGALPPTSLCPSEWIVSDEQRQQAELDLTNCLQQMSLFRLIAERWNAEPGPWPLFPAFLVDIYSRLLAPEAA